MVPGQVPSDWAARIWPHQAAALTLARKYLAAGVAQRSAMIRMPTGTGKSGVIAVVAHRLIRGGHVLVLAPWDALVDQLVRDLKERFWQRIGIDAPTDRPVQRLLPSTAKRATAIPRSSPHVFVATIATLTELFTDDRATFEILARTLAAAIVDEGHYEPAPTWSRAVRSLGIPVVLLTATPYRNDFKLFNVDTDYVYSFSHEEAERLGFVRKVAFHEEGWTSAAAFARALVGFVRRNFGRGQPRVIVRCATRESVQRVTHTLAAQGVPVVGIHETFERTADGLFRRSVPNPDDADAPSYWVHQYKLLEGIDSPEFRVLGVFEPLQNERSFVQQVGRVLRNPTRDRAAKAWIFSHPQAKLAESWAAYRAYDRGPGSRTIQSPADFARKQPEQYVLRRFRAPFDITSPSIQDDIDYPRSTHVFVLKDLSVKDLTAQIESEWDELDRDLGPVQQPDADTRIHPYIAIRNSPLLIRKVFPEFEFGITVYRRAGRYLFYYDTHGHTPEVLANLERVEPSLMERLYFGTRARLTSVSLRNTNLGRHDVRRRSLQAYAVDDLAPDLGDHAHFASTATGVTGAAGVHRYVGFTRSHVRDSVGGITTFAEWKKWLGEVADALDNTKASVLTVFERYAEVVPVPADSRAENVLLDFDPSAYEQAPSASAAKPEVLAIEDLCISVDPKGDFTVVANGASYAARLDWSPQTRTYLLSAAKLDAAYVPRSPDPRALSLVTHLNRRQAFRVIPRSGGSVYARGRFYKPRLPLWGKVPGQRFDLLRVLEPDNKLAGVSEEKGDTSKTHRKGAGWESGCLFDLIDKLGAGTRMDVFLKDADVLVCDDLGTEIADFLAVNPKQRRVIAMHAKAFRTGKSLSASSLQEVSAQAVKNLGFLQPYFVRTPKNLPSWDNPWKVSKNGKTSTVNKRIRRGPTTGQAAWDRIRDGLRDPDYTREVWLVLGQGLSQNRLETERARTSPSAEVVQVLFSLQATWAAVSSVGARLRVFCSP